MSSISSFATKLPDLPPPDDEILVANNLPVYQPMTQPAQPAVGTGNPNASGGYTCEPEKSPQNAEIYRRTGVSNGGCTPDATKTNNIPSNTTPANKNSTPAGTNESNTSTVNNRNAPVVNGNNALKGRDPDLIFAGDKIKLSNGEIYTAKSTDTLSGIASMTGNSLESLMKQNGFDSQLLGKNADGKYFDLNKEQQRVQQMPVAPGGSVNSSQGKNTSAVSQSTSTTQSGATQQLDAASSALKKLEAGDTGIKGDDLNKLIQLLTKFVANLQDSKNPALSGDESKDLGILVEKYRKQLEGGVETVPPAAGGSATPNSDPEPVKPEPKEVSEPLPGSAVPQNTIA